MATLVFTLVTLVFSVSIAVGAKVLARRGHRHTEWDAHDSQAGLNNYLESRAELAAYEAAFDTSEFDRSTPELQEDDLSEAELVELDEAIMERWRADAALTHALDRLP